MSYRDRLRRRLTLSSAPSMHLRIDRLVLEGFEPTHRHRIGDSMARELEQLFHRSAGESRDASTSFDVPLDAPPEFVGAQAARAVFHSIETPVPAANGSNVKRQTDDAPPRIDRTFELPPRYVFLNAPAVPECDKGQTYDPAMKRCRPAMCGDFDINQAKQFVIQKLGETAGYVPQLAAAMRRGRFAAFFPANLEAELKAGAATVIAKVRDNRITIECTGKVAVAQAQDGKRVLLPVFYLGGKPPWSQSLMNRVVLHECLHLVCSNFPSQPGKDPYENASRLGMDPAGAMHDDMSVIMSPFPNHIPRW
jgi:hypothetical protein